MKEATDRFDVCIAGAGVVGAALAAALADALGEGVRIALVDRGPLDGQGRPRDIRAWAISAGSQRLLDVLGIWPAVAADAQPVTAVDITDSALDDVFRPVLVSYDNRIEQGEPATYIVESDALHQACLAAMKSRSAIDLRAVSGVEGYEIGANGCSVRLAGGRILRASLLVAADGRGSPLREMAGIKVVRWSYPQVGIVTTVRHEKPHGGRAMQHFLPAGPFAILPLTGNRSCVTWTENADRGREVVASGDDAFLQEVDRRFGRRLGEIELAGPRGCWPLDMHLARSFISERFALAGDAAHGVHPIAGQGLNLGLRDVAALVEVVTDAVRLGLDPGSRPTLERYERWRRLDTAVSAATFDGLNRLFSNDFSVARTVRDLGLGLVERLPAVKSLLVAEAAGLTGEVPRLLRGLPP